MPQRTCCVCKQRKAINKFSKTQLKQGRNHSKCKYCITMRSEQNISSRDSYHINKLIELLSKIPFKTCMEYIINGYIKRNATVHQYRVYPSDLQQLSIKYLGQNYLSLMRNVKDYETENNYDEFDFMLWQQELNGTMRSILVNWLIDVCRHSCFKIPTSIYFIAVNLLDRYLAKAQIRRSEFQLAGMKTYTFAFCVTSNK